MTFLSFSLPSSGEPATAITRHLHTQMTEMAVGKPENVGRETHLFSFPDVVVHATLLPNGKVLHWGSMGGSHRRP